MKDYESMSDFEINKAVLECIVLANGMQPDVRLNNYISTRKKTSGVYCENSGLDFNFQDARKAWPIIAENEISIIAPHSKNPLRDAMIVFLMMQESK